jgi:hypothetical protein
MKTELSKTRSDLQDQIDNLQQSTHDTKSCLQDQIDDLQQLVGDLTQLVAGSPSPDHIENLAFMKAIFLRSLHQGYMPAEKLIDLALDMDTRNLDRAKSDRLAETLERAIDAHQVEAYKLKVGKA